MDKFYQVYFAYQELGNKYLNMVEIPDFYLKKDISLVESYLSMDCYEIENSHLCSIYPTDSISLIKPKKLVIPETYRGRKIVVVEFVAAAKEESCDLMVVGNNVRLLTPYDLFDEDRDRIISDLDYTDVGTGFFQIDLITT
jgi:hypothetical protein